MHKQSNDKPAPLSNDELLGHIKRIGGPAATARALRVWPSKVTGWTRGELKPSARESEALRNAAPCFRLPRGRPVRTPLIARERFAVAVATYANLPAAAAALGIAIGTLQKYLSGKSHPPQLVIERVLADAERAWEAGRTRTETRAQRSTSPGEDEPELAACVIPPSAAEAAEVLGSVSATDNPGTRAPARTRWRATSRQQFSGPHSLAAQARVDLFEVLDDGELGGLLLRFDVEQPERGVLPLARPHGTRAEIHLRGEGEAEAFAVALLQVLSLRRRSTIDAGSGGAASRALPNMQAAAMGPLALDFATLVERLGGNRAAARALGVAPSTVSRYVYGKSAVPTEVLDRARAAASRSITVRSEIEARHPHHQSVDRFASVLQPRGLTGVRLTRTA